MLIFLSRGQLRSGCPITRWALVSTGLIIEQSTLYFASVSCSCLLPVLIVAFHKMIEQSILYHLDELTNALSIPQMQRFSVSNLASMRVWIFYANILNERETRINHLLQFRTNRRFRISDFVSERGLPTMSSTQKQDWKMYIFNYNRRCATNARRSKVSEEGGAYGSVAPSVGDCFHSSSRFQISSPLSSRASIVLLIFLVF